MTGNAAPICHWGWLEKVDYQRGLDLQRDCVAGRQAGRHGDRLLLMEHNPVITLGRAADSKNVHFSPTALQQRGVEIYQTGRGGDVTFHGPGQVVGYPIIDLNPDRRDVRRYVRDLEEVLIGVAADHGIEAARVDGLTGVWVGREKLAAIGVHISRWVTSHGFAFNVGTDLSWFDMIVPCGLRDHGVTSLERLLGKAVSTTQVAGQAAAHFSRVFGREMVRWTDAEQAVHSAVKPREDAS